MLTLLRTAAIASLLFIAALPASAQVSATASVGATIVNPTVVSKQSDMKVEGVVMSTSGVLNVSGKVMGASIKIAGTPNYAYSITVPQSVAVKAGAHTIVVGTECCEELGTKTLATDGTGSISIEGVVSLGRAEMLLAANTDDEEYFPNGLPVTFNHN